MTAGLAVDTAATGQLGRLRAPAIVIGIGLGGFVDGIVLHQVFRAQVNTLWDGLFHLTAYLFVLAGLFWLWQRWRPTLTVQAPWRLLIGGLLAGWGVFNLVEGVVNHHVLAIHHFYDNDLQWFWDLSFLALGAALLGAGLRLTREPDPADDAYASARKGMRQRHA